MKIDGSRPVTPAHKRAAKKTGDSTTFETSQSGGASRASSAGGMGQASAVNSVDALLALQGDRDERTPGERAAGRAFTLLDLLDDIKIGLLDGGIPRGKLTQLIRALGSERETTGDNRLEGLLDEVEVRARVELAKHESAIA